MPPNSARGKKDKEEGGPHVNVGTFVNRCDDLLDDDQACELVRKLFEARAVVRSNLGLAVPVIFHKLNSQLQKELREVSMSFEKDGKEASRRLRHVEADRDSIRMDNQELQNDLNNREKALSRSEHELEQGETKLASQEKELEALRRFKKEHKAQRRSPSPTPRMKTPHPIRDGEAA